MTKMGLITGVLLMGLAGGWSCDVAAQGTITVRPIPGDDFSKEPAPKPAPERPAPPPPPPASEGPAAEVWGTAPSAAAVQRATAGWRTYDDGRLRFRYPPRLTLVREGQAVTLDQSIAYPNNGDCDMSIDDEGHDTLQVFGLSFRTVAPAEVSENADIPVRIGRWQGKLDYNGSEGCGQYDHYFPLGDGRVLLVEWQAIQALGGISTGWDREAIRRAPGTLSSAESLRLFQLIMATLKVAAAPAR